MVQERGTVAQDGTQPAPIGPTAAHFLNARTRLLRRPLIPSVIRTKIGWIRKLAVRGQLVDDGRQLLGKLRKQVVLGRTRLP